MAGCQARLCFLPCASVKRLREVNQPVPGHKSKNTRHKWTSNRAGLTQTPAPPPKVTVCPAPTRVHLSSPTARLPSGQPHKQWISYKLDLTCPLPSFNCIGQGAEVPAGSKVSSA